MISATNSSWLNSKYSLSLKKKKKKQKENKYLTLNSVSPCDNDFFMHFF